MANPSGRTTISSLAKELNLSTCTVSKILNPPSDGFTYAPATIRKVRAAATRLNYTPNVHARSLRTKKSMLIGLVVPSGVPFFSGTLVEKIEGELRALGYETIISHSTDDSPAEARLIRGMRSRSVDGLFWIPNGRKLRPRDLDIPPSFPLVLLDRPGCSRRFPTVITDNENASRELALRIQSQGYDSLVVLSSDGEDASILEREAGIRDVFKSKTTRLKSKNEIDAAVRVVEGRIKLITGKVLVCLTQNLAQGALLAFQKHKMEVGIDVGFASFDSLPLCEIWQPSITRIQQNIDSLAHESVHLLTEKIQHPELKQPSEIRVRAELIWGDSVPPAGTMAGKGRATD